MTDEREETTDQRDEFAEIDAEVTRWMQRAVERAGLVIDQAKIEAPALQAEVFAASLRMVERLMVAQWRRENSLQQLMMLARVALPNMVQASAEPEAPPWCKDMAGAAIAMAQALALIDEPEALELASLLASAPPPEPEETPVESLERAAEVLSGAPEAASACEAKPRRAKR